VPPGPLWRSAGAKGAEARYKGRGSPRPHSVRPGKRVPLSCARASRIPLHPLTRLRSDPRRLAVGPGGEAVWAGRAL